jgi:endonuclease I
MKLKVIFSIVLAIGIFRVSAQIPTGYYDNAEGLSGTALRQALHDIIDGHSSQSYSALWNHFISTDINSSGKVWDIYSDIPGETPPYVYNFISDQCGSYSEEGDCYNREHSWPKSWFNEDYPMYTDLFHVMPTDGYVNGQRGNDPYGETRDPFWVSQNGSKLGISSFSTMTGTVFEPIDAYKGDVARNYLYMATRYYNEDDGWYQNELVDGAGFTPAGLGLLLKWHNQDPVSQKEIDRNNEIHDIQNNRNPFIDHPEYAEAIWGNVNTPPYFIDFLDNMTLVEGDNFSTNIQFGDDDISSVSISMSCIFCNADFVSVTPVEDGVVNINMNPTSGDAGTYSLAIIADDGTNDAANYSISLTVEEGNSISEFEKYFTLSPNPSKNTFTIHNNTGKNIQSINVYSIDGKLIESIDINENSNVQFGQNYMEGYYIIHVLADQNVFTYKLIKE